MDNVPTDNAGVNILVYRGETGIRVLVKFFDGGRYAIYRDRPFTTRYYRLRWRTMVEPDAWLVRLLEDLLEELRS